MEGAVIEVLGVKPYSGTLFINRFCIFLTVWLFITCTAYKKDISVSKPQPEKKWTVSTVAGGDEASLVDGPVSVARFHFPNDVAVAPNGDLYVTDGNNRIIRKISGGQVSGFAGSDFGIVNGKGISAQFKFPTSICMDGAGNIYTTDARDPRVRKISPQANVTIYAGSESSGFADGPADIAQFRGENMITADAAGNVYLTDAQNNRIRKISINGMVSTIAGSGTAGFRDAKGSLAEFNFPTGIALDSKGNLFVSDGSNFRIRKISPGGDVVTIAGKAKQGTTDGDTSIALFDFPADIAVDGHDNLFVVDGSRIRKISPQGNVSTIAGSVDGFQDGDGASAKFFTPYGLGIDAEGNIYVADTNNNRIRKISSE
jgi:sugar lactone lactonase YvrE